MAGMAKRLEDGEMLPQARALISAVYGVTGRGGFFRDVGLRDDVRREAIGFMSTIAEGLEAPDDEARRSVFAVARRMSVRLRAYLVVAADQGYLGDVELEALVGQLGDISRGLRRESQGHAAPGVSDRPNGPAMTGSAG